MSKLFTNVVVASTKWKQFFVNFVEHGDWQKPGIGYVLRENETLPWVNIDTIHIVLKRGVDELPRLDLSFDAGVVADGTSPNAAKIKAVSISENNISISLSSELQAGSYRLQIGCCDCEALFFKCLPGAALQRDFVSEEDRESIPIGSYFVAHPDYSIYKDLNGSAVISAEDRELCRVRIGSSVYQNAD